jgi:hypothetical protein
MMTTPSMVSPSNKCRFDDDEGPSSTPLPAPLRQRVGDEVGEEVPPVVEAVSPPLAAKNVVLVPQDDINSDDEGSDDMGSSSDNGEDKAMHIPFSTTPPGIMWYKCPIWLG